VSYKIDVSTVSAVLLADGWHRVKGRTFSIEPYEYVAGSAEGSGESAGRKGKKKTEPAPPVVEKGLSPVLGARWTKPSGEVIACPVTSLLALRHESVKS
jgi:hypothetical protein